MQSKCSCCRKGKVVSDMNFLPWWMLDVGGELVFLASSLCAAESEITFTSVQNCGTVKSSGISKRHINLVHSALHLKIISHHLYSHWPRLYQLIYPHLVFTLCTSQPFSIVATLNQQLFLKLFRFSNFFIEIFQQRSYTSMSKIL